MRNNIYDILRNSKIDIQKEYSRIHSLFYDAILCDGFMNYSVNDIVSEHFEKLGSHLVGRCLSLADFNNTYGFNYDQYLAKVEIDYLVSFSEYALNFLDALIWCGCFGFNKGKVQSIERHIKNCMDELGYAVVKKEGYLIIVEKNPYAVSVAEISNPDLAFSTLEFNHYKMKGDLERKKSTLLKMADDIEPKRVQLREIDRGFESNLFNMLNKFIRHNSSNNAYISGLSANELEKIYDEIYQMWLLAKLRIEFDNQKAYVKEIITQINK